MKKTVIWQIIPPEHTEEPASFLFGTIHVRDQRAFGWLRFAWPLIDRCSCVATEFDLGTIDVQALQSVIRLPQDQYLDNMLTPGAWKKLRRYCRQHLGLGAEEARKMHPMILHNMLSTTYMQTDAEWAVDEQIYHYAREKGMEIAGVEKFEDQLKVLRLIPPEVQIKQLTHLAKHFSQHRKKIKKMLRWYAEGDIQRLYQSARKDSKGMRKVLIHDRNRHMANQIADMSVNRACFFAIGAGHLAGEKGVLRLLRKKGFQVKPIMPDTPPCLPAS